MLNQHTIMFDIVAASREPRQGIAGVNRAVGEIDQATQQNAALVEQAAAFASVVSVFTLDRSDFSDEPLVIAGQSSGGDEHFH